MRPATRGEPGVRGTRTTGQAFGIAIQGPGFIPLVAERPGASRGRRTVIELASIESLKRRWRPRNAVRVVGRRYADGRLSMVVEHDAELGYQIYAPRHGRYVVSPDGRRITSVLPKISVWRWQIVLLAQALPLAATLQGLELLHASAVVLDGRTLAFSAPSGTGKTSVAAHLVAHGASLLTDDVLALERVDGMIVAYPGAQVAKVAPAELAALPAVGRRRLGTRVGKIDKILLAPPLLDRPQGLDRVYFLRRSASPGRLRINRCTPDPFRLLAHSFNTYVHSSERVVNQLAVHARIVETVGMYTVVIPPSCPAVKVAAAVRDHAGGSR